MPSLEALIEMYSEDLAPQAVPIVTKLVRVGLCGSVWEVVAPSPLPFPPLHPTPYPSPPPLPPPPSPYSYPYPSPHLNPFPSPV